MKRKLFLIILIAFYQYGYSQDEFSGKLKPIPPKELGIKKNIPLRNPTPKKAAEAIIKKPDSLVFTAENLFKDTTIYKKESNSEGVFYRRNQYLGSYKTQSFTATIRYRDAAFVDGDKIKVYLNNKVIQPEVSLNSEFDGFKINLVKGINKIDFEALNEGFASPNTAQFEVYDDKGVVIYSSQWNVGTGYKAAIILIKE